MTANEDLNPRHASFDLAFDETLTYLLYPGFRKVQVVPGTTELFKLSKYTEAIAKDYKRLMLYLIPLDDIEECDSDDGQAPHWSSFGFLPTGNATTTLVLPNLSFLILPAEAQLNPPPIQVLQRPVRTKGFKMASYLCYCHINLHSSMGSYVITIPKCCFPILFL